MQTAHQIATTDTPTTDQDDFVAGLLQGFRFRVCQTREDWEAAIEVRRAIYRESLGYEVPVPDEYDRRSWLFLAEDTATGKVVGTMRVTPRFAGRLESEEYFTLPRNLRDPMALEITRFAILPEYRKGKTFLPVVSLGLFKLAKEFGTRIGGRHLVVCSKAERMWTYEWMRFKTTGLKARYEKLNDAEHELISCDIQRTLSDMDDHPFGPFFKYAKYEEVEVPARIPSPGMPWDDELEPVAVGA
jgi:N-acyl-L-homoserine lactone synthetase